MRPFLNRMWSCLVYLENSTAVWFLCLTLTIISLFLFAGAAANPSADPASNGVLVIAKTGYFVLTTDDLGNPALLPIRNFYKQVIVLNDPTPTPDPTPLPARVQSFRDNARLALGLDPQWEDCAIGLVIQYRDFAKRTRSGELSGDETILQKVREIHSIFGMDSAPRLAAWSSFRTEVGRQWDNVLQVPTHTDKDLANLLDDMAAGVSAAMTKTFVEALQPGPVIPKPPITPAQKAKK